MAILQKANLGTVPTGSGGDDQRTANTKFNANVDVLSAQAVLTTASPITSSQALTAARHLGRRVSINIAAGGTITLPAASACAADGVLHIRNVGKAIAIAVAAGSGDALALTKLNTGEAVLLDTDGVNAWRVLMRGRAYGDDEVVNGALSVGGDLLAFGKLGGIAGANLLVNASGELGNIGWNGTNFTADRDANAGNGPFFRNAVALTGGPLYNYSDYIPAVPGIEIAIQGVIAASGMTAGAATFGVEFVDASNALLRVIAPASVTFGSGPTFRTAAGTAPAGTTKMRFRIGVTAGPIGPIGAATYANLKCEAGTSVSAYSQEATVAYLGGAPAYSGRPTFDGKVPWDTGNLPSPVQTSQLGGGVVTTSTTVVDTPYSSSGAFANMWSYNFTHKGLNGTALISFFGGIAVAGTSSNLTVGYNFKLIDTATGTALDESVAYQDLLAVIGNWSNFYHVSASIAATGLVVGRTYRIQVSGFKTANVGPIALAINIRGVTV
ncbi:hypothetical protein WS75_22895 [Burkholderia sp. FL-7-2-10-S1-D7]|uniref:hypothetical protein n=1 Tax=Burkholderia sp. FL-7-2-10-S1-D7 TaxID=1637866 RepID=UPI00075966B1|nr:hypothetical protein [Burkholderia sp. FL-7-2-10-S1-D7]KVF71024.1 hypothetical protein WS75_22895 [Burkholderia sp. FL-7-2-10-S1-D7]